MEKMSCKEEFLEVVSKYESLVKDGIDYKAFINFITAEARKSLMGANSAVMKYFAKLGYSESLVNESYRMFGLTIHCKPLTASMIPAKIFVRDNVVTDFDRTASELILTHHGEVVTDSQDFQLVCHSCPKTLSWTYGIRNKEPRKQCLDVTLNFSNSKNLVLSNN